MGHIPPQRDPWAEMDSASGPPPPLAPAWLLVGGHARSGLVYEHRNGAQAHLHVDDEGYLNRVTRYPMDELDLPDLEGLPSAVNADVEQMTASPEGRAMLALAGVSEMAAARDHRGRPRRWTLPKLLDLATEFVERGDRWTVEHALWAKERGLERRTILKLMRRAEELGLVTIGKAGGARSPNVYALIAGEIETDDPRASAHWHRERWRAAHDFAAQLEGNWQRQVARREAGTYEPPTTRELSESPEILDQLAADGETMCGKARGGLKCALRAGHSGGCFAWLPGRRGNQSAAKKDRRRERAPPRPLRYAMA